MLVSGWCMLKDPAQHALCPRNFSHGQCPCECGHPGEKPVERLSAKRVGTPKRSRGKTGAQEE